MDLGLTDRIALVTGGGSGIGAATARAFAREGASVVVVGRRAEPLAEVVAAIEADGGTAWACAADIAESDDVDRMVHDTVQRFGGLHCIVNSAAIANRNETLLTGDLDEFDRIMNTDLRGAWLVVRAGAKAMIAAGEGGAIVNVSSINAVRPGAIDYSTAKAGVEGLTRATAKFLGRHQIRVNCVRSGYIDTELLRYAWDVPLDVPFPIGPEFEDNVPLGRVGRPDETAAALVWLCSSAASYITGACLDVDGGTLLD